MSQLIRNEEIIDFPCTEWIDENGKTWSNPQLAFMIKNGWQEYVAPAIPQTPEDIAAELKQRIKQIEDARLRHLTDNIHPDALFLVQAGKALGRPKATLFHAWCEALGLEMYHRIALTESGQWDMALADFSGFTAKPCSVGELFQEASGN